NHLEERSMEHVSAQGFDCGAARLLVLEIERLRVRFRRVSIRENNDGFCGNLVRTVPDEGVPQVPDIRFHFNSPCRWIEIRNGCTNFKGSRLEIEWDPPEQPNAANGNDYLARSQQ